MENRSWLLPGFWVHFVVRGVGRIIVLLLVRPRGRPLPFAKDSGFLLICNHASFFDPVFIGARFTPRLEFMARSSLFRNRLFGALIRALHTFPIERGTKDAKAFANAKAHTDRGAGVLIFAEGTRTLTGDLQPFRGGVELMARATEAPIYLCYVEGAREVLPKGRSLWRAHAQPIEYRVEGPIMPEEYMAWPSRRMAERLWRRMLGMQRKVRAAYEHRTGRRLRPVPPPDAPMKKPQSLNS